MKFGYIVALRNEKCSSPYELNQGEYKIGSGVDNDIRIRDTHPGLSKIHAVLNVDDEGIVTIVNKSSVAPVKVNDQECPKAKRLSHLDIFHIIDKKFQYFNEKQIQRIDQKQQLEAVVKKVTVPSRRTIAVIEKSRTITNRILTQRLFKEKFLSPETRTNTKSPKMNISIKSGLEPEETNSSSSSSKLINKNSDDLETSSKLLVLNEASRKEDSNLKMSCSNKYLSNNEKEVDSLMVGKNPVVRLLLSTDDEERPKLSDSVRSENNVQQSDSSNNRSEEFSFSLPNLCSDEDNEEMNGTEIASIKSENISASECNNSHSDHSASSSSVINENILSKEEKLTEENDAAAAEALNNEKNSSTELETKSENSIFKQSTEIFDPRDFIFSEANQIFDETPNVVLEAEFESTQEFVENDSLAESRVELAKVESAELLEKDTEDEINSMKLVETAAAISEGEMDINNLENSTLDTSTILNDNDSTAAISGSFQESGVEISTNNTVEDSSLTETSLNESTTAAISGSCQSFSSFTNNADTVQETEGDKNVSEIIDVVNFTITTTPNLNERRTSVETTSQLFESVNCTSTPFHPPNKDKSLIMKDCSLKKRNLEGIRNRRSSLRKHFKFKNDTGFLQRNLVHKRSKSVGYKRETRPKSSMVRRNSLETSSLHTSEATTLIHKIAHGSAVAENTPEKLIDLEDETPKSHIKSRRSSKVNKSIATSIAEESTLRLTTPDKLEISSDKVFKTPVNTPALVGGKNNGSKSLKAARMSNSAGNKLKEIIESPISNKKLDKSLEDSPINSLRDLRSTRKSSVDINNSHQKKINDKPNSNVELIEESAAEDSVINTETFNLSGIDILPHDDAETSSDLFSRISGKQPLKFYNKKSKSLSPDKIFFKKLRSSTSRKTEGELPSVTSPRVDEWVKEQTTFVQNTINKLSAAKKKDKKKSLIRFSTRRVSKLTNRAENSRKSLMINKGKKLDQSSTIIENKTPTKRVLRPRKRKSESKEVVVPKKSKKIKAIIEEVLEENDISSKTKITGGKRGKKQQTSLTPSVQVATVKNLRNGQNKENQTPQIQIEEKSSGSGNKLTKSGQKNSARRNITSKLKTPEVEEEKEAHTPKLRATANRSRKVPLKNQIKKNTPNLSSDDGVVEPGSSKSKAPANNTRKRKLQDEKLDSELSVNEEMMMETKKRGRKVAKTEEQEEAALLSENDASFSNINKTNKKRGRKEAKTVTKKDEKNAADLSEADEEETDSEIVVETKKRGTRKAETVVVKNVRKKIEIILSSSIKLNEKRKLSASGDVESTSPAKKSKRNYRKKVVTVKSPAPPEEENNVEHQSLPSEKPKRKYNKKKVQEEKLIDESSSPVKKVTRSTRRNGLKEIEESSSPTKATKSRNSLSKTTKSAVSPNKAGKLSVSPRKAAKSSISPRKSPKLSFSPKKAANTSVSPKKAAKLSVSMKKLAKLSASPIKAAKLSASPTKPAKSQETIKKTIKKNVANKKSPVAQEAKRKNAKKVHEDDVDDTPTKMTLRRKRGGNQEEEEEEDSPKTLSAADVNSKKVRFMSPFPKKLTPKLTPKRTRRAKK